LGKFIFGVLSNLSLFSYLLWYCYPSWYSIFYIQRPANNLLPPYSTGPQLRRLFSSGLLAPKCRRDSLLSKQPPHTCHNNHFNNRK
jgi:hypothetical protein